MGPADTHSMVQSLQLHLEGQFCGSGDSNVGVGISPPLISSRASSIELSFSLQMKNFWPGEDTGKVELF